MRSRGQARLAPEDMAGDQHGVSEGLTDYERQRLENIRRNQERMQELSLPSLREVMEVQPQRKRPAAAKGMSAKRRLSEPAAPRRRSNRLEGKAADGSEVASERQGETLIRGSDGQLYRPGSGPWAEAPPAEPRERHPSADPLPFRSLTASPATDAAFIQLLARLADGALGAKKQRQPQGGAGAGAKPPAGGADLARLRLREEDVSKVTRNGVVHLDFHPSPACLLLACADKSGNLGLWNVDEGRQPALSAGAAAAQQGRRPSGSEAQPEGRSVRGRTSPSVQPVTAAALEPDGDGSPGSDDGEGGDGSADFDGTFFYSPHYSYACGLRWVAGGGRLLTASYDGSLRGLDPGAGGASALLLSSEDAEWSCMDATEDGRTVLLGDKDGELVGVDTRAPRQTLQPPADLHRKKINTIHFDPGSEQVFVTASTDTTLKIWDLRTLGPKMKPLAEAAHAQACQSAYLAPDGSRRVVSTSFDDSVRIWDAGAGRGLAPLLRTKHDNQTGRWVSPFRAVWAAAGDAVIVGNMKRFVDVLDAGSGALRCQLHSESMTAIASRSAVHPALPALAAATASGRVHVYR